MKIVHYLFAILGSLGVGATVSHGTATAAPFKTFAEMQKEAELACELALKENTIEALEEYLRKYPFANTACRTLALDALGQFSPGGPPSIERGESGGTTGYGG